MSIGATGPNAPRFAHGVRWTVALGALVLGAWLWHQCYRDPKIRFLTPQAPAEWILFPRPAGFDGRAEVELTTRFRRQWKLESPAANSVLTYRAFTKATVTINGQKISTNPNSDHPENWKSPVSIDLTRYLTAGSNEILISIANQAGPPALWAWIDDGKHPLVTDEHWDASLVGSVWLPARLVSEPLLEARDGAGHNFNEGSVAGRARWLTLLVLAGAAALVVGIWPTWVKFISNRKDIGQWNWLSNPARVILAGAIAFWVILFWHNFDLLPRETGFDAPAHGDYIRYIMEKHSLPLANEGGVMYNPPLYYLICAGLLKTLSLSLTSPLTATILRGLALSGGIVHLLLIASSLRLLFPEKLRVQAIGLLIAAALPPNLYVSHYITNEWLVAVLVTGTIYLTLRVLRSPRLAATGCAAVGACLGAALLTKFTALLVVPFVIAALAIKLVSETGHSPKTWLKTLGATLLTCALVCGWHYARVWVHFGKPLVGSWEAESGFRWWQDQGYLTFSQFLNFGDALTQPAFSARHGFWDGIYSTLWADGLCGGRAIGDFRPPWDYALMPFGSWLALGLTLAILAGSIWSLGSFLRCPTPERLILNGLGFGFCFALSQLVLQAPYYGELKAFYGLVAILPICVFGAQAWDAAAFNRRVLSLILSTVLGTWALINFATYWIPADAAQTQILLGSEHANAGRWEKAIEHQKAALQAEPANAIARAQLASSLDAIGHGNEARAQIEKNLADHPDDARCHLQYALIAQAMAQGSAAEEHIRRALAIAPDCIPAHAMLVQLLQQLQRGEELVTACRETLRVDPANPEIHLGLGILLSAQTETTEEAGEQLRLAAQLAPSSVPILNSVAWTLATHVNAQIRDGALAVLLATKACNLTGNRSTAPLLSLAAAQAEAGYFEEAVSSARLGQKIANEAGQTQLAEQCGNFASWYQSRRPFRQPAAN